MQAKNEISEELGVLSAVVNEISRETPYGVPAGYFDGFPARMLDLTGKAGTEGSSFLSRKDKPLTFSVPEGYFEGFAQGLLDKIKGGRAGGAMDRKGEEGWNGPEDAKEELARLSPLINGISRKTPYETPAGFFEELSPVLALLADVRERTLYTVPENYFDGLAQEIMTKVSRPARVISINRGFRQRSWWKYSAAAVVAGFVFTIGWLRLHTSTGSQPLRVPSVDVASNLVKVSDQDLQSYLDDQNDQNNSLAEPISNSTATLDINDSDVKSLLGDIPDGELKQYMEEHGGPNDIATN
jgi:hypothetical protein